MAATADIDRRTAAIALSMIVAIAAGLRLPTLAAQSLWYDEGFTWMQTSGGVTQTIAATASDNYPPLYNLMVLAARRLLGDAEWVLRLPAALLGVATVAALYWVGALLQQRRAGLLAALLLALSGFHVWHSQEARMYALLAFCSTVQAASLIALQRRPAWPWGLLVFVSGSALLYSHPYGAVTWMALGSATLLAQAFDTPIPRSGRWWPAVALASSALTFVPWAPILWGRARVVVDAFWIPDLTPLFLVSQIQELTSGLAPALIAAAALPLLAGRQWPLRRPATLILLSWALAPLIVGLLVTVSIRPLLIARYLIGSLPALHLLAGIGLASLLGAGRRGIFAMSAALTIVALPGLLLHVPPVRQDWRAAMQAVRAEFSAGDCLFVLKPGLLPVMTYYWRTLPCMITPEQLARGDAQSSGATMFLILGHTSADERLPVVNRFAGLQQFIGLKQFSGVDIYAFRRP